MNITPTFDPGAVVIFFDDQGQKQNASVIGVQVDKYDAVVGFNPDEKIIYTLDHDSEITGEKITRKQGLCFASAEAAAAYIGFTCPET